jgi:hypothetical protein
MQWKIELFHKILKSDCKAEDAKLRTAQRLANLMPVFCILSWRSPLAYHAQPYGFGCVAEDGDARHQDRVARPARRRCGNR